MIFPFFSICFSAIYQKSIFTWKIPPQDQTDRWSGRFFRSLSVVNPPVPANFDPTQADVLKRNFLESHWNAKAAYRARVGQSVVLRANEQEVESRSGRVTLARTYFNVYQRTAFLQEPKKVWRYPQYDIYYTV